MEAESTNFVFWTLLLILLWLGLFVIPSLMLKRAISQVISIFRDHHSRCTETPRTADELGLASQRLVDRLFSLRDYKPYALQLLVRVGVIRVAENGKVCLVEEKLAEVLPNQ